ncbi:hypothetical protein J2Z65_002632 [Paenibacillus aceris]|uniref:Uncharacterized protein n=1 Tax=Paenibacillus aceris TaxID=869555 RepID=A0ABS4HXZ0_9BACL|nr:hypothetical protein [Paenibacillus aceris]
MFLGKEEMPAESVGQQPVVVRERESRSHGEGA